MSKITPDNIIAKLDRYAELLQLNAKFDLYAASGTPHDFGESICAEFELKTLEAELLEAGMRRRNETTPWESHSGFEYGHERRVLGAISRQVDTPLALSLMEHVGVEAPIFHRSLWKWWRESRPEHRKPSLAYLLSRMRYPDFPEPIGPVMRTIP